ncbi:PAS domain S-box protein [Halosimplex amylolyticum]|uniref:PAS domain S-box protein n=1 Tax=Halosimplex amylolyticum TaxID=3396616 RepID=UPI003F5661A4
MDAGSIRGAVVGRGAGDTGDRLERGVDTDPSHTVTEATGANGRTTGGQRVALALVALAFGIGVLAVLAAHGPSAPRGGPGALAGLLAAGVVGLAASSDGDDAIAALTDEVERVRAGEDVTFETDREGQLGELTEAVAGLADDLRECERERDLRERVIDSAPVGITVADATAEDCPLVAVNERFEELTGYEESECLGENCRFLQGEGTADEPVAEMRRAVEAEEETTVELRNYRKDGTEFWNRVRLAPVADDSGEVTHFVGFQEDVTERVEREAELERRGSLLDAIFEQLPMHIYVKDREARHVRYSTAFAEESGSDLTTTEVLGKTDPEVFDAEFAEQSYEDDLQVIETGEPIVNREEYVDHADEWNLTTKVPWRGADGEIRGLIGVSRQITERKRRQQELEQYRAYTDDLLDSIDDVFYVLDAEGNLQRWNETLVEVTGYDDDEFESMHATDFIVEGDRQAVREGIEHIDDLAGVPLEGRLQTRDGERIPYEIVASPMETPDGERVIVGIARDITERKERERKLEAVVENTEDPIYIKDSEGRYQFVNDAVAASFGLEPEDVVGRTDEAFFDEATVEDIRGDDERVVEGGESVTREVIRPIDGDERVFLDHKYPYRDQDGEIVGLMGISRDITDRKATERELREREERLDEYREYTEAILDAVDDVFYVLDAEGDLQRWNGTLSAVTGYDEEAIASMHATDFFAEGDRAQVAAAIETALETGDTVVEVPFLTADGEQIPFEFVASRIANPDGDPVVVGIGRDVSDRRAAQQALREREQRLEEYREYTEDILDAIDDVFYVFDDAGQIKRWNESFCEVTGYTDAEIESMHGTDFFPESEHGQIAEAIATVFTTGEDGRVEAPVLTKDGQRIPYEFVASRLENPDGDHVLVGIGRDVSVRRARERELRTTKERLQKFIDTSPVGVVATDPDGRITLWNDAMEDILGWSEEEILWEPYPAVPEEESENEVRQRVLDGESVSGVEVQRVRKDGEVIDISLSTGPIRNEDGEVTEIVGYIEDITERKERERELVARSAAIEQASDGMAILDEDGVYEFVNQAHADVYGYDDPAAFLGETWEMCYDGAERDRLASEALPALANEGDWRGEAVGKQADGERFPQELSLTVLDDGRQICVVRDITERKERERELARFKRAVEASGHSIYMTDADREITYVNPAFEETTGYSAAEAVGETPTILHSGEHSEDYYDALWETIRAGEVWDEEIVDRRKNGELYYAEQTIAPVTDENGTVDRFVAVQNDVTERKERERELERTTDLLARAEQMANVGGWTSVVSSDGRDEIRWTDNVYEILGVSRDEGPLAEKMLELVHPDDREAHRERIEAARTSGEPWDVEYRVIRDDGSERWVHSICEPVVEEELPRSPSDGTEADDGRRIELRGSLQDVTERVERERELERTKDLLQQAGRIAGVGGWELDLTGPEDEMTWTDELYRLHGVSPDTEIDLERAVEFYHPDDRPQIRRYFQDAIGLGQSYDMEVRLQPTEETVRWVRAIGDPVTEDGEVVRVRGSIQDITEQKERELALESLHEATRGLLGVEDDVETAELVVDTAHAVLDVAGVAVYLLDDTSNQLDALACSEGFEALCDAQPVGAGAGDSLLWNTYVTGTPTVFDDTQTAAQSSVFGPEVSGGLLVPIGDHGVFVVATRDRAVDPATRRLAETLVATTEAAFDRLASEETLRERDAELEARNRRLRRQIQITDLIRRIDQSLIQAESREAIESAVCDRLVESDDVAFAWIGSLDAADERVEPSAWAGDGADYLDGVSLATGGDAVEPAVATAVSESPTVVRNVVDDLKREDWRQTALSEGFQSVLSVPVAFEEYFYGVLTVYATDPDAFGDLEREVFAELGESVAHSINAVETQRALHTDQRIELTLDFDAEDDVLGRLAAAADCTIEFAGLATHSDSEAGLFVTASGAPSARVAEVLEDLVSVSAYRVVSDGDDADAGDGDGGSSLFELTVDADSLPSRFVRHGAGPQSIRATAAGIEAVVDVPTATDVREFVEMLAETHPSVDLASRRTVERGDETGGTLATTLFDALTDRQLEVLRTAYFAGFFEWPRTSTGEDVADMLDVSQPTVNRHLRLGQQRLLRQLFEESAAEVEATAD